MAPSPHGGRFGSSPSSTGTIPKTNGNVRNNGGARTQRESGEPEANDPDLPMSFSAQFERLCQAERARELQRAQQEQQLQQQRQFMSSVASSSSDRERLLAENRSQFDANMATIRDKLRLLETRGEFCRVGERLGIEAANAAMAADDSDGDLADRLQVPPTLELTDEMRAWRDSALSYSLLPVENHESLNFAGQVRYQENQRLRHQLAEALGSNGGHFRTGPPPTQTQLQNLSFQEQVRILEDQRLRRERADVLSSNGAGSSNFRPIDPAVPSSATPQTQDPNVENLKKEVQYLKRALSQQQDQSKQMTLAMNQVLENLHQMQGELYSLHQRMDRQETRRMENPPQPPAPPTDADSHLDSVSQQRDFESHASSWDFDITPPATSQSQERSPLRHHRQQQRFHHRHPAPTLSDPWSTLLSPGSLGLGRLGGEGVESESSASNHGAVSNNAALNNQVPPGIRANNYWDNFRSFSRQNRLSSTTMGLSPAVAQVMPRQQGDGGGEQQQQQALHHQGPGGGGGRDHDQLQHPQQQMLDNAAMVEPFFANLGGSPSRPRRKQKINREQNVSSSSNGRGRRHLVEAALVMPMPQQQEQQPQQRNQQRNEDSRPIVQPIHQQVLNPVVSSIKRSIYSQINDLIAQHEERPDQLAKLYHDLQTLNATPSASVAPRPSSSISDHQQANNNMFLDSSSSSTLRPTIGAGAATRRSLYDGAQDEDPAIEADDEEGGAVEVPVSAAAAVTSDLFKMSSGNKRFSNAAASANNVMTSAMASNRLASYITAASNVIDVESSGGSTVNEDERLASLGAVGGSSSVNPEGGDENAATLTKKRSNEKKKQTNVAVPKNIQRDGRKGNRANVRREKPRNMPPNPARFEAATATAAHGMGVDGEAEELNCELNNSTATNTERFVNINLQYKNNTNTNPAPVAPTLPAAPNLDQSDMAEADQDHESLGATGGAAAAASVAPEQQDQQQQQQQQQPREQGLDRVPTRLSNSDLDLRRQEEEESLQNLVDEVLNSSADDFVPGNGDRAPTPK